MYVDDSGNPNLRDRSNYYVISGVIIHESDLRTIELETQQYMSDNFGEFRHCEIHVHDIFKGRNCFSSLTLWRKQEILNSLYEFINKLPITIITIGINKDEIARQYINPQIFNSAWTFLIERFDNFICDNGNNQNEGVVIVDRSSKIPEKEICKIVKRIRKIGSGIKKITHLVEEPIFIESHLREGIQLADASAYCSLKHLTEYAEFEPYWNVIQSKLRRSRTGVFEGYGYKIFP